MTATAGTPEKGGHPGAGAGVRGSEAGPPGCPEGHGSLQDCRIPVSHPHPTGGCDVAIQYDCFGARTGHERTVNREQVMMNCTSWFGVNLPFMAVDVESS